MSRPSSADAARAANLTLVRSGAAVLGLSALMMVIAGAIAQGGAGALGAVLGSLVVAAFFGVDAAVYLRPVNIGTPTVTVVVALYALKLAAFGLLVAGLASTLSFDHATFVISVIVEALIAAAVAVRAFSRMRVPYVQP